MKNKLKSVMKYVLPIGIFLLITGTVFAAMNWQGTPHVENIKDNLELIQIKMNELKSENSGNKETIREIEILLEKETQLREQRERELQDKQQEIENKITEIQEKIDEINQLKNQNAQLVTEKNNLKRQLEQALRDVQEIEALTEAMINE